MSEGNEASQSSVHSNFCFPTIASTDKKGRHGLDDDDDDLEDLSDMSEDDEMEGGDSGLCSHKKRHIGGCEQTCRSLCESTDSLQMTRLN